MRGFVFALLVPVLAAGCGESDLNTVSVSGVITLNGKPLENAAVMFKPLATNVKEAPDSTGITDSEGRYTLKVTTTGQPGAMIGKHRVSITLDDYEEDSADDETADYAESIPARYNVESELTFTVPEEGTDKANFDLTTP